MDKLIYCLRKKFIKKIIKVKSSANVPSGRVEKISKKRPALKAAIKS